MVELVFIPVPEMGHFVSTTEFAKCLVDRDEHLSITILVIRPYAYGGPDVVEKIQSLVALYTRIRCISIKPAKPHSSSMNIEKFISDYIEAHKANVEHAISTELLSDGSVQLAGIVFDMFCSSMIDVAHKFKVPSYLYFASNAAFLGFTLYLMVHENQVGGEFDHSVVESMVPSYAKPVPTNVLPNLAFDKEGFATFLYHAKRYKETKGFIINTFAELEPHAIHSLATAPPPVYAIGPLLDLKSKEHPTGVSSKWNEIMNWLDDQSSSSVIFLCFGSGGCFSAPQLKQIAIALEQSGISFLWSIRRPPPEGTFEYPNEYQNVQEALPEGFLERTETRGRVCGWAPQVEVLAHQAIGGFVSHCGWNSILESLWHGVAIATWPLYAEQKLNAFLMVVELGLAVELRLDYRGNSGEIVMADVIERAVTSLMADDNPVRKKVKEMSEKSRKAVVEGGSSYSSLGCLIEDLHKNIETVDI